MGTLNSPDTTEDEIIQLTDIVRHQGKDANVCGVFPTFMRSVIETVKDLKSAQAITTKDMGVIVPQLIQSTLQTSVEYALEVNKRNKELELLEKEVAMKQLELDSYQSRVTAEIETLQAQRDEAVFRVNHLLPLELAKLNFETNSYLPEKLNNLIADTATKNSQKDINTVAKDINLYELQNMLPAKLTDLTTETGLKNSQKALTDAKTLTEAQNRNAVAQQVTLYANQAKAFKFKHDREVADMVINAYLMASSQSTSLSNASTAFGTLLADVINSSKWV